ncbi:MAG TPA: polyprenol phosphomannose-dependent alpha 1,6 mannosyltransferase MptB [Rugosimonospora sp.]
MGGTTASQRCRRLGLAGSAILAAGGLLAGARMAHHGLPVRGLGHLRQSEAIGLILGYAGVTVLVVAWCRLGATVRGPEPPSVRSLYLTLAAWAAPLLLVPPLFSRDAYSYLAQGAMTVARIDPYHSGPAALGGPLLADIPAVWQHSPTPYGPVFLTVAAAVAAVASSHILLGLLGMRLLAVLGLAVMLATLPRVAAANGIAPAPAVWLAGLNPLVLLHLVAGAHNDALMLAFLMTGLAAALRRRPVLGAVLITLGALVKAPAALGLLAVAALWSGAMTGPHRLPRAVAGTGGIAVATMLAVSAATGLGYGWLGALGTPASPGSWSVTSVLGRVSQPALEIWSKGLAGAAAPAWRWAGMAAAVGLCAVLWRYRDRLGVVLALGLMLTTVVVLGPSIRPWYLLWGLVPIAVSSPHGRAARWLRLCCVALAFSVPPGGFAPTVPRLALCALGAVAAGIGLWGAGRVRGGVLTWPAARAAPGPEPEYSA